MQEERQSALQAKAEQAYDAVEKEKRRRISAPTAPKSWGNTSAPPSASRKISLPGSVSVRHFDIVGLLISQLVLPEQ